MIQEVNQLFVNGWIEQAPIAWMDSRAVHFGGVHILESVGGFRGRAHSY